jgi:hypothetical protein
MKRINRRIGQLVKEHERLIARRYAATLVDMRAILSKQYEKYEQGGELTLQEMLKHDRMKKMMREMNFLLKTHYKDVNKVMEQLLGGVYTEGFNLTAWAVESETRLKLGYSSVSPETLTAMLKNPVDGLTLNNRLERQRVKIIASIQNQVTQGLLKNETYGTMAKRLKGELEGDLVKATRIVRTEGHRSQETGKLDAAAHATDNGVIMMKEWNTMEDGVVRRKPKNLADHKKLNEKKIVMDALFDDGLSKGLAPGQLPAAGSSINCRCFLTYSIARIERVDKEKAEVLAFDRWEKERLQAS